VHVLHDIIASLHGGAMFQGTVAGEITCLGLVTPTVKQDRQSQYLQWRLKTVSHT